MLHRGNMLTAYPRCTYPLQHGANPAGSGVQGRKCKGPRGQRAEPAGGDGGGAVAGRSHARRRPRQTPQQTRAPTRRTEEGGNGGRGSAGTGDGIYSVALGSRSKVTAEAVEVH